MKATGIVRRVDELGRIVIPKELRKNLRMREGSPLEIFMSSEGEIVLKKYSLISSLEDFAKQVVDAIFSVHEQLVLICDKDEILHMAGSSKSEYINKRISLDVEKIISDRKVTLSNKKENAIMHKIIKGDEAEYNSQIIVPINASGDTLGAIIMFTKEPGSDFTMSDVKSISTMANFLAKQME